MIDSRLFFNLELVNILSHCLNWVPLNYDSYAEYANRKFHDSSTSKGHYIVF